MKKVFVKEGVVIREINEPMLKLLNALLDAGSSWSYSPTLTSATDGKHKAGSLHYKSLAWDVRTSDLPKERWEEYTELVKSFLTAEYDVILEKDHIHVEFDPK